MWFRRRKTSKPAATDMHRVLRDLTLRGDVPPSGLARTSTHPNVWAVLLEMGFDSGAATLCAVADGTTSLYLSSDGGVLGAGAHPSVRAASEALLCAAQSHLDELSPVEATPLPGPGRVRFYVRTDRGTLGAEAAQAELGAGGHLLSPLFFAGDAVLSALRATAPEGGRGR